MLYRHRAPGPTGLSTESLAQDAGTSAYGSQNLP